MRFQVNDIVRSAPGWRSGVFVITGIEAHRPKNPYTGVSLVNGKSYRLSEDSLDDKRVGVSDPDWNKVTIPAQRVGDADVTFDENYLKGVRRARREIDIGGLGTEDLKRWDKLASLKPGDILNAKVRGKVQRLTFRFVTDRGYKFVFVAENESGTRYKYPLSVITLDGN